jgi:hypothetical protein
VKTARKNISRNRHDSISMQFYLQGIGYEPDFTLKLQDVIEIYHQIFYPQRLSRDMFHPDCG